jgi:uncharacterized protein YjbI with pentapeptide repeats
MKSSAAREIQSPRLPKRYSNSSIISLQDDGEYSSLELSGGSLANHKVMRPLFETVVFRKVILGPSEFIKPRFVDCRFESSDLSGIDWEKARFRRVEFLGCRIIGAQLIESEWEDISFLECNLERAVFVSAAFRAARFIHCALRETSLEHADFSKVTMDDCDLTRADLRASNLSGTDLRGSKIDGAQVGIQEFKGAIVDSLQAIQIAKLSGVIIKEKGENPFQ